MHRHHDFFIMRCVSSVVGQRMDYIHGVPNVVFTNHFIAAKLEYIPYLYLNEFNINDGKYFIFSPSK